MKGFTRRAWLFGAILALIFSVGCASTQAPLTETTVLEDDEAAAVLEELKPSADNVLDGLINQDYASFSKDFSSEVLQGMDENAFNQLIADLTGELGQFKTSEITAVLQDDSYSTVVYTLSYEQSGSVIMRVVFDRDDPTTVSGIWFDSPVLLK